MTVTDASASRNDPVCSVAIIGFGYIGCVIGAVLASRGMKVTGIDSNQQILDYIIRGRSPVNEPGLEALIGDAVQSGNLAVNPEMSAAMECDVVLITVGTPLSDKGEADLSQLETALYELAPFVKDGQLVILKSTVPPGTTSNMAKLTFEKNANIHLAFCPERIAEGNAVAELTQIPVIVGGVDSESAEKASQFWQEALGVKTIVVSSPEAAELAKLADNLWIDTNIALANELAKLSDALGGIDVLEVIKAANTLPKLDYNVNILLPSLGVGGSCLTKDPWFIRRMGETSGLDLQIPVTSRTTNDSMPVYTVGLIDRYLMGKEGRKPEDCHVAVLGLAFKSNTGDCRFSPVSPALDELTRRGYRLTLYDGWVTKEDMEVLTDITPSTGIEDTIRGADCVAFFAGHQEFHDFPLEKLASLVKPGAMVLDGRMFFSREKIGQMEQLGLRYKGIGR